MAAAIKDYDVGISIMEEDFKRRPEQMMYSEYPDALVKRGLAKARSDVFRHFIYDEILSIYR